MDLASCFSEYDTLEDFSQPVVQKNEVALTERWILPATAENFAPQDLFPFGGNGVSKASRYFQDHAGHQVPHMQHKLQHQASYLAVEASGQQLDATHDAGVLDYCADFDSELSLLSLPVPCMSLQNSHFSSCGNTGLLDHFSSAFSMSGSRSPKDEQLTLMEHYTRLKQQQKQQLALQHVTPSYTQSSFTTARMPAAPLSLTSSQSSVAHNFDARQLEFMQSSLLYDPPVHLSSTPSTEASVPDDKAMEKIYEHPWVVSHLQELTSCFSLGMVQEHMAHLLDLPKSKDSGGSPSYSRESHTLCPKHSSSTSMYDLQDVQSVTEAGAVKPQIPSSTTSTFSTAHPFGPSSRQTAPSTVTDIPSFGAPTLTQTKLPSGPNPVQHNPSVSSVGVFQPSPQPYRQVNVARQLRYTELECPESDLEPTLAPCTARGKKEQVAHWKPARSSSRKPDRAVHNVGDETELSEMDHCMTHNRRRKHHNPWSVDETLTLIRGVEDCGGGKWADIKKRNYKSIEDRSAVDLKDKWRNLMRVALLPAATLRIKCAKRRELPLDLLVKVRKLDSIHNKAKASIDVARSLGSCRSRRAQTK